jgi:hypothetical protein
MPKRSDLGSPITKYNLQVLQWRDLFTVFVPLSLLVLAPLFYGLWRTLYGYSNFGPAAAYYWGRSWFLASGFLVLFLLFYTYRRLRNAHTWVEIYSWGLFFHNPPGKKRVVYWEDIIGVTSYAVNRSFIRIFNKSIHYLIIYTRKYRPLHCHPNLHDRQGLKKTIKKQVYSRLRPKILQAYKMGEIVPFGDLSISKQKLYLPKQEIPWDYVEGISVQKGNFMIKLSAQKAITIPIRKIQNIEILVHLIKTEI